MSGRPQKPNWTDEDTEAMFAAIGRYVMMFQWVEGLLDQILLLGWDYANWGESQTKLARMRNFEKVEAVRGLVLTSPDFARVHTRPKWCTSFQDLIERLHEERERRNSLLHSQFLFEFVKIGLPPLRSHRAKTADGKSAFNQEYLTRAAQEKLVKNLAQLGWDVNRAYVQLIHDYKAPVRQAKDDKSDGSI